MPKQQKKTNTLKRVSRRYRFPSSGAPHGLVSRDVEPGSTLLITGTPTVDPANGLYFNTYYKDIFNVLTQYIGPRLKPVKKTYHPLEWNKTYEAFYRGSASYIDSGGRNKLQEGTLNNLSHQSTTNNMSTAAYNAALSRLYDKLRGSVDLSIDTYQWKQSARMIQKIFDVARYVRTFNIPKLFDSFITFNIKRGRDIPGGLEFENKIMSVRKNWRHFAKEGGGLWLEYSYGLKPLVSDFYDTMAEFQRSFDPILDVEGSATMRSNQNVEGYANLFTYSAVAYRESVKDEYHAKFKASFDLSTSAIDTVSRFSTLNPLGFIWENTPFSFCVDWFVGVGGYLRSFENALLAGKQFKSGFLVESSIFEVTSVVSHHITGKNGGFDYSLNCEAEGSYSYKNLRRTILTGAPFPRGPTIKFDFSSLSKALNAMSLLGTFFSKH